MLLEEIRNIKSSRKDLKNFGLVVGTALFILAAFLFWRAAGNFVYFGVGGVVLVLLGFVFPRVLKPLQIAWMTIAVCMGFVMTRVILMGVFYLILTPLSLLCRIFGKRFLDLVFRADEKSYWKGRVSQHREGNYYEQQF